MDFYYPIITACIVSADSFVAGIYLNGKSGNFTRDVLRVIAVVFVFCLVFEVFALYISEKFGVFSQKAGGLLLVLTGAVKLFEKENSYSPVTEKRVNALLLGLSIGADGAVASASLKMLGFDFAALTVSVFHFLFIIVGAFVGKFVKDKFSPKFFAFLLFVLGIYKLL